MLDLLFALTVFSLGFRGISFKGIKIADIFILLLFLAFFVKWYRKETEIQVNPVLYSLFALFFVAVLASLTKVGNFKYAILDPFRYLVVGGFFLVVNSYLDSRDKFIRSFKLVYYSGLLVSAFSVAVLFLWFRGFGFSSFFMHQIESGLVEGRVQAFFYDPNHFASFLLLPFFAGLYFLFDAWEDNKGRKLARRITIFASLVVIIGGTVATGSRGGMLSLAAGIIVLIGLRFFWDRFSGVNKFLPNVSTARFLGVMLLLLVVLSSFWWIYDRTEILPSLFSDDIRKEEYIEGKSRTGTAANAIIVRFELWKGSLLAFKDNIFLGVGTSDYINDYSEIAEKYNLLTKAENFPHNTYLDLLAETGLFGFLTGFSMILYVIWQAFGLLRGVSSHQKIVVAVLIGMLVAELANMMLLSMFHGRRLWFLFALIVAYSRYIEIPETEAVEGGIAYHGG